MAQKIQSFQLTYSAQYTNECDMYKNIEACSKSWLKCNIDTGTTQTFRVCLQRYDVRSYVYVKLTFSMKLILCKIK